MKKKFKLTDLDCANCAAKMEDAIKKLDGVNDATPRMPRTTVVFGWKTASE